MLVTLLSRMLPVLFVLSAALLLGRFLFDRLWERYPRGARAIFAITLTGAVLLLLPFVLRTGALLGAELAYRRHLWPVAARRFAFSEAMGETFQPAEKLRFAFTLTCIGQFEEARELYRSQAAGPAGMQPLDVQNRLSLAISEHFTGHPREALESLALVRSADPKDESLRDYLIGMSLERLGRRPDALGAFEKSLAADPSFFPPRYQLVRILIESGDRREAARVLGTFPRSAGKAPPDLPILDESIKDPTRRVPRKEFLFVPH